MRKLGGIIGMAAIAGFAIAGACAAESGAIQSFMSRLTSTQATHRPAGTSVSAAQRRAETDRIWHEAAQGRCAVPVSFAALPGPPRAC